MTAFVTDMYSINGASPARASVPATASGAAPGGSVGTSALGLNLGGNVNTKISADNVTVLTALVLFGFALILLHVA